MQDKEISIKSQYFHDFSGNKRDYRVSSHPHFTCTPTPTPTSRREGDSNPRSRVNGTTVFETAAFDRSAISPSRVWVWVCTWSVSVKVRISNIHTHTSTTPTPTPSSRRKRDSNPRFRYRNNGFQDRRIRPLCHFSFGAANLQTFMKQTISKLKNCQILTNPDL